MGRVLSRSCVLATIVVACALVSAPAYAASDPSGVTANAVSDHAVLLSWAWPSGADYPDEIDVYRDGAYETSVDPVSSTSFLDTVGLNPLTTHTYQLRTVTNGVAGPLIPASALSATLRADPPNAPTSVAASFSPLNIATVTWTRGAMDADVIYQVIATPSGGGTPITTGIHYAPGDSSPGLAFLDGFSNYTNYTFTVAAVENVESGDPGGTAAAGASAVAMSNDILPPSFNGGAIAASRSALGTITATWPSGSDAGTGIASYTVCVDVVLVCKTQVPAPGSSQSATLGAGTIRNDGLTHPVSVFATDVAGNQSPLLTFPGGGLLMPIPATPVISLVGGNGNGCAPLVASASSSDPGTPGPTFHLLVDGVPADFGTVIAGDPFKTVTLVANATFGADTSAMSAPVTAQVYDPDGPPAAPLVHGQADPSTSSETLSWSPVTATGAPIIGYQVTVPGVLEGIFVEQSDNPTLKVTGLQESENYVAQVTAVDGCKRQSPLADSPPVFRVDDATPPTAPGLGVPTTGGHDVQLSWTPSTDNVAVDDYKVFRNGTQIARTNKTSYDDTGLADALSSDYTVVATDTAGNQSATSVTRTATTKDVTAPSIPAGILVAVPSSGGVVTLRWGASTDNVGVTAYQVIRDGTPIANVTNLTNGLTYTDRNATEGPHHYDVRAFDAAGNGSALRGADVTSSGVPRATVASALRVVKANGAKVVTVGGGASGARIVLSFTLQQAYARGVLHLQIVKSAPSRARKGATRFKSKVRVSLPAGTGRTTPGKRLGERPATKGAITIPLGRLPAGPLRLIVTATNGTVTLSGKGAGSKAPTIVSAS